jgi:hypothetical protein
MSAWRGLLCEAAYGGQFAVVELLPDAAGIGINVRSLEQRTAFVCAAAALSPNSLNLIASHGGPALRMTSCKLIPHLI